MMKLYISLLLMTVTSDLVFAACGEEEKHCYYYQGDNLISDSPCKIVQCANIDGGLQIWTWDNGNTVDVRVPAGGDAQVNGKPGRYFDKANLSCYEIIGADYEAVCNGERTNENRAGLTDSVKDKRELCFKILGGGIYNGLLESLCGFDGDVKEKLKSMYASGICPSIITEDEIVELSGEILTDTRERYQIVGEKDFCEGNMKAYYDLLGN